MSLPLFDHPASDGEQHLFKNHEILKPFFEEGLVSLDDTLKILLDVTTETWIVELLLDDARSRLPWGRLPNCLSVLTDIWHSWKRRHVLPPAVLGAAMVFERRFSASQQYVVTPEKFYWSFQAIPALRDWTEHEVNRALEDEAKKEAENESQSVHAVTENEPCPPSPVSISASTEARFFEQSTDCGEISPLRGDESPPHKRFKKWYHRELWVDPRHEVPEIPSSPEATSSVPKSSLTPSARGRLFEEREQGRRQMIAEFTAQADEYSSLKQSLRRGGDAVADARE
ncbi:unnamed protein product [Cladocopium goreaui]|uniref:Uncharacterized protein n=1 Tax=Cladocopium goreaui TaxID=2562237 RepID=A0A9P1DVZ9_9DINO|nr:unnamed protein product [Cladocopium goreaui]